MDCRPRPRGGSWSRTEELTAGQRRTASLTISMDRQGSGPCQGIGSALTTASLAANRAAKCRPAQP